jgi:hypothetical protein
LIIRQTVIGLAGSRRIHFGAFGETDAKSRLTEFTYAPTTVSDMGELTEIGSRESYGC